MLKEHIYYDEMKEEYIAASYGLTLEQYRDLRYNYYPKYEDTYLSVSELDLLNRRGFVPYDVLSESEKNILNEYKTQKIIYNSEDQVDIDELSFQMMESEAMLEI